jgi:hypothetical protein
MMYYYTALVLPSLLLSKSLRVEGRDFDNVENY